MIWIDTKYANLLSSKLDLYKVKKHNPFLANFRCPICGDSQKSKTKARGYLWATSDGLVMKCHNCNASMKFDKFIEHVDERLYKQYRFEKFSGKANKKVAKQNVKFNTKEKMYAKKTLQDVLQCVKNLKENHPAVEYCRGRKLPDYKLSYIYYVDDVSKITSVLPEYRDKIKTNEPRIILPFYDRENNLVGLTMRAIDDNKLRYVTLRLDENKPMIYGYDQVNLSERIICVEGPIDSLFLPNAVAVGGSDMKKAVELLPDDTIYVFDNEPRNVQICSLMSKLIKSNRSVCIWPTAMMGKDINHMVQLGYKDVASVIYNNTFSHLNATAKLSNWRKC